MYVYVYVCVCIYIYIYAFGISLDGQGLKDEQIDQALRKKAGGPNVTSDKFFVFLLTLFVCLFVLFMFIICEFQTLTYESAIFLQALLSLSNAAHSSNYIYIYRERDMCIYIYIYTYTYTYMYIYIYIYIYKRAMIQSLGYRKGQERSKLRPAARRLTYISISLSIYIYIYMHRYVCICVYIYIYIYIYTHTYR